MMELDIKAPDLLRWARYYEDLPRRIPRALANSMNYIGQGIIEEVSSYMAQATGLDPSEISRLIEVHEASPTNLSWSMDASQIVPGSLDWSRPWAGRDTSTDSTFDNETLVKIVTREDELVCQQCQDAAEESPYTLGEATAMLPIHPNCRCLLQAFNTTRRLPVEFSSGPMAGNQLMTLRQLRRVLRDQVMIQMRLDNTD